MKTLALILALAALSASAREPNYARMAATIATVESNNDPLAMGDDGRAVGLHQTWTMMVDQLNIWAGDKRWTYNDRWAPVKSTEMVVFFLQTIHRKRPTSTDIQLMARWRNPWSTAPRWYVSKLKRAYFSSQT